MRRHTIRGSGDENGAVHNLPRVLALISNHIPYNFRRLTSKIH